MCYSASASFISSVALAASGGYLVTRIKKKNRLALGSIPLLFAFQQAIEGFIWLNSDSIVLSQLYLFFACVIWPIWMPLAFFLAETKEKRKMALSFCLGVGVVIGIFFLMDVTTLQTVIKEKSIHYELHIFQNRIYLLLTIGYALAGVTPFFISSLKSMKFLGLLLLASGLITAIFYAYYFVSLWCFWSALFSLCLLCLLRKKNR